MKRPLRPAVPVRLLQRGELRLRLLQDRNIGVGVFPERKKVLIRGTSLRRILLQRVSAGQAETGQRTVGQFCTRPRWSRIFWNSAAAAAPWPLAR